MLVGVEAGLMLTLSLSRTGPLITFSVTVVVPELQAFRVI